MRKECSGKYIYRLVEENTGPRPKYSIRRALFFAFNARDDGRRIAMNALASLITQLLECEETFSPKLEDQLESLSSTVSWTFGQLRDLLCSLLTFPRQTLPVGSKILLVLDAIDECDPGPQREQMLEAFQSIVQTCQRGPLFPSFIVTSRPYADITFSNIRTMSLDLNAEKALDQDLARYIQQGTDRLIKRRPPFLAYREKIVLKLQDRAEKMFLLVELLLDLMVRLHDSSPKSIEKLLASLPSTLSEIYQDTWSRIAPSEEPRAKMIFSWLLCAFRPLKLIELGVGIATYDFHSALKAQDQHQMHARSKGNIWHPLAKSNQKVIEPYMSLDLEGDLNFAVWPLDSHST